uniref:Uncharacterized protein n=1 Tax=Glossina brevipalpis TaxID=37001 RepID=A0A1A9WTE1_9MUSC
MSENKKNMRCWRPRLECLKTYFPIAIDSVTYDVKALILIRLKVRCTCCLWCLAKGFSPGGLMVLGKSSGVVIGGTVGIGGGLGFTFSCSCCCEMFSVPSVAAAAAAAAASSALPGVFMCFNKACIKGCVTFSFGLAVGCCGFGFTDFGDDEQVMLNELDKQEAALRVELKQVGVSCCKSSLPKSLSSNADDIK